MEGRKGVPGREALDNLVEKAGIEVIPFTHHLALEAAAAWRRFGKGNHPAALNLCDCCSYALAQPRGEALLYKGRDFALTDIRSAL